MNQNKNRRPYGRWFQTVKKARKFLAFLVWKWYNKSERDKMLTTKKENRQRTGNCVCGYVGAGEPSAEEDRCSGGFWSHLQNSRRFIL